MSIIGAASGIIRAFTAAVNEPPSGRHEITRADVALPGLQASVRKPDQSHSCGRYTLASHFAGKPPAVRAIFDKLLRVTRKNGPITVLPEKSRIAFQVRMSFAAFVIQRNRVDGHVVLARRLENPRFRRIETFSPRNHLHAFRFESLDEIDAEVVGWLAEAYGVGEQRHLV